MSTNQPARIAQPAPTPLSRIESQYRSALAKRWFDLVLRSALFSTTITAIFLAHGADYRLNAAITSIFAAAVTYPLAVYPILSARRSLLVAPKASPLKSSLTSLVSSTITSAQGIRYLTVHLTSGAIFATVYAIFIKVFKPSTELGFLAATPRHPLHLNERFIFLVLGNAGLMVLHALWDLMARRLAIEWPNRKVPLGDAVAEGLMASCPMPGQMTSLILPPICLVAHSVLYFALRKRVWVFLLTHTFGLLRPFVINFAKPSRSLGISIIPHLIALELLTLLATRLPPVRAMIPYLNSPLDFESLRRKSPLTPEQHLTTALKSKNPYYLHFTLMELLRVSHNPTRRQALFASTSKSQPPILSIWEDLLLHLGRAHQTLITRGGTRISGPGPSSRPAPVRDTHTVQVRQANIFRPAPAVAPTSGFQAVLQSALEGPVQPAPPAILAKAQGLVGDVKGKAEMKAVEWGGEVMGRVEQSAAGGTVLKEARGFWAMVGDWTGGEWASRQVGGSVPEVIVIERILAILATLACASLKEDTYGYVQQVLPATMEIMIRHRSALQSLQSELMVNAGSLRRGDERAKRDIQTSMRVPILACESSLRRIADTFGESLAAFRFPTAVGNALGEICNAQPEQSG